MISRFFVFFVLMFFNVCNHRVNMYNVKWELLLVRCFTLSFMVGILYVLINCFNYVHFRSYFFVYWFGCYIGFCSLLSFSNKEKRFLVYTSLFTITGFFQRRFLVLNILGVLEISYCLILLLSVCITSYLSF